MTTEKTVPKEEKQVLKFKVSSTDFAKAIQKTAIAIAPASKTQEASMVKIGIVVTSGACFLLAHNGYICSTGYANIEVLQGEDTVLYIDGAKLKECSSVFSATECVLTVKIGKEIEFNLGKSTIKLPLGEEQEIKNAATDMLYEMKLEKESLLRFGNMAASSFEVSRFEALKCVAFKVVKKDKKLLGVSTNSSRVAYAEMDVKIKCEETAPDELVIPIDGVVFRNMLRNIDNKDVIMKISERSLQITCGFETMIVQTQEIVYPFDQAHMLLTKFKPVATCTASLSELMNAINLNKIALDDGVLVIDQNKAGELIIKGNGTKNMAVVPCTLEGEVQKVAFSCTEIEKSLALFKSKDIVLEFTGALQPLIIRSNRKDPNCIYVMPHNL